MTVHQRILGLALLMAPAALHAQEWDLGVLGGYGFNKNASISSPAGSASAGLKPGAVFGAYGGSSEYRFLGGEAGYLYRASDYKLSGAGKDVSFSGSAQFVDFRIILHFSGRESHVRPFVAVGGGVAVYTGTGLESSTQPLNNIAALTATRETKPMMSAAVGVKVRLSRHLMLRAEFRDYITPFPKQVIAPVPGATQSGWLHNFTPVVGIGGVF